MQSNSKSGEGRAPGAPQDGASSPTSFYSNKSSKLVTPPRPKDDAPKSGFKSRVNRRANSTHKAVLEDLESRMIALHAEISKRVVGPVRGDYFKELLPPVSDKHEKRDGKAAFEELMLLSKDAKEESHMYEPLVQYFTKLCTSKLKFCNQSGEVLEVFEGQEIKPDINVYNSNDRHEAMFEVKFNNDSDPFNDDLPGFVKSTSDESKRTLGQITGYATCHQAMDFRTHVFSALIFRTYMRLLRWDRSGVIVTQKLQLDDANLFEFFLRFSAANSEQRGRDPTVCQANLTSSESDRILDLLNCRSSSNGPKPLLDISVGNKHYIISKEQSPGSTSPIGRSTRCFKAYCPKTRKLVLLKDSWRVIAPTLKPEHEIYTKLHERQVPNIPEVYHGADIGEHGDPRHTTQTKSWLNKTPKPLQLVLRTLRHYRIALEYLQFELEEFRDVWEMIVAIRDAAIAHDDAAIVAKVLHRDISVGNIMFKRDANGEVHGYLIDWDLSLDLDLDDSAEAQEERAGTWQFLAIRLLEKPADGKPLIQTRIDDIESFFHVMTWMALRHTAHSLTPSELTSMLETNFDAAYQDAETEKNYITNTRRSNMVGGNINQTAGFSNPAIRLILSRLRNVLRHRYTALEAELEGEDEAELISARKKKEQSLKTLEDPHWLLNLLNQLLDDEGVDWVTHKDRVDRALVKRPKYNHNLKRKTESSLHSEGSNKVSRNSRDSTPHDKRS